LRETSIPKHLRAKLHFTRQASNGFFFALRSVFRGLTQADGANADGFKHLLCPGLQELGLEVVDELTRDFLLPRLSETEAERMIAWYWGLSR
jgi:hypothetical protein